MDEKYFRDTRTQLYILRSRGIVIKNKKKAKKILLTTNYYNLINGYKEPFLLSNTPVDKYKPGTCFEEIYALYLFDKNLRTITLEALLEVETQMKSILSYTFSHYHGHKDYLYYSNFDSLGKDKYLQVSKLLSDLYKKISQNFDQDASITHYVNGKNYIPLWVLVNLLSFGDISKFYSNMLQSERNEVAKQLKWGLRENQIRNSLFFLSAIRNRCAHSERLYSYECYTSLAYNNFFRYFRFQHSTPRNKFFSVLVALKLLLPHQRFEHYCNDLTTLFKQLNKELHTITISNIYSSMGLPRNWYRLTTLT